MEKKNETRIIWRSCRCSLLFRSFSPFISTFRRSIATISTFKNSIAEYATSPSRSLLFTENSSRCGKAKEVNGGKKVEKKKGKKEERDVARKIKCKVNAFRAGKSFLATVRIFLSGLHLFMSPTFAKSISRKKSRRLRPPFCRICSRDFSPSLSINKENWTVRQREREREEQKASGTMKGSLPHFKEIW